MVTERPSFRVLAPTDVWIHAAAALGAPAVFLSGPLLQSPGLARKLGMGASVAPIIHSLGAGLLGLAFALHLLRLCLAWLGGRGSWGLLPTHGDLGEFLHALAFGAGLRADPPAWGRFSYREKVPYLVFLVAVPVALVTGLPAAHPAVTVGSLGPGGLVALGRVHQALGALLLPFLLWHLFFAHLQPGALWWNGAWVTGKAPLERIARTRPGWAKILTHASDETPVQASAELEAASVEDFLAEGNRAARAGRYADAERAYLEALRLYPGYSQALFNLGVARLRGGWRQGAKEVLTRFLEQDPFSPMADKARKLLEEIERGDGRR